jgi:hypothetical protein
MDAAQELMHAFLIHFFLEEELRFARYLDLKPPRGRFLHDTSTAAKNFQHEQHRRAAAAKRGRG